MDGERGLSGAALLTGHQIRTARELLNWTHGDLAATARVPTGTLQKAESTDGKPSIAPAMRDSS
jgi:DNA-binding transcriptional regulator YiaG